MEEIKEELLKLGFDIKSKGFFYWIDLIKLIKENPNIWRISEIYEYIAEKNNSTYSRVERALRTAREPAKSNIEKEYNYYKKIDNQTFINLIRYKLI